jgi:UDP-N-acetylmuramoylalanine--D-glutamate ligase
MELVAFKGGVGYVNDSKATNVASTLAALGSYGGEVHAILGGSAKGEDYSALKAAAEASCAAVYLNGATADDLASALSGASVPVERHATLEEAFAAASQAAEQGETVLLSPAAASFDQFKNYEARGERFKELVAALQN